MAWEDRDTRGGRRGRGFRDGSTRGGAELTELGHKVLDQYRKMEAKTEKAIAGDLIAMRKLLPNGGE